MPSYPQTLKVERMEAKYIVIGKVKHTTRTFKDVIGLQNFMQERNASDYLIYVLIDLPTILLTSLSAKLYK